MSEETTESVEETPAAQDPGLPTELTLVGAGRDLHTRATRRNNRFQRRLFYVGPYTVRPGRRVPARVAALLPHMKSIVEHVERGALKIMWKDREVPLEAFLDLCSRFRDCPTVPEIPSAKRRAAEEAARAKAEEEEAARQEAEAEAQRQAEESAQEQSPEDPPPPPEGEPVEVTIPVDELTDTEEPEEPEEPSEAATVEDANGAMPLPEGWRSYNKRELKKLFEDRHIAIPADDRNQTLINYLEAWEEEQV